MPNRVRLDPFYNSEHTLRAYAAQQLADQAREEAAEEEERLARLAAERLADEDASGLRAARARAASVSRENSDLRRENARLHALVRKQREDAARATRPH